MAKFLPIPRIENILDGGGGEARFSVNGSVIASAGEAI
jgi:hypothetical protein